MFLISLRILNAIYKEKQQLIKKCYKAWFYLDSIEMKVYYTVSHAYIWYWFNLIIWTFIALIEKWNKYLYGTTFIKHVKSTFIYLQIVMKSRIKFGDIDLIVSKCSCIDDTEIAYFVNITRRCIKLVFHIICSSSEILSWHEHYVICILTT